MSLGSVQCRRESDILIDAPQPRTAHTPRHAVVVRRFFDRDQRFACVSHVGSLCLAHPVATLYSPPIADSTRLSVVFVQISGKIDGCPIPDSRFWLNCFTQIHDTPPLHLFFDYYDNLKEVDLRLLSGAALRDTAAS